jgi:hypothetical protein
MKESQASKWGNYRVAIHFGTLFDIDHFAVKRTRKRRIALISILMGFILATWYRDDAMIHAVDGFQLQSSLIQLACRAQGMHP